MPVAYSIVDLAQGPPSATMSLDGSRSEDTGMWEDLTGVLEGKVVRLEPLARRHEEGLFEAARDERIWRWMPYDASESREVFHARLLADRRERRGEAVDARARLRAIGMSARRVQDRRPKRPLARRPCGPSGAVRGRLPQAYARARRRT